MKGKILAAMIAAFFAIPFFVSVVFANEIDDVEEHSTLLTETHSTAGLPSAPRGTGTVSDFDTDPQGRRFYTIMTPDEHVFYLIVETDSSINNVHFLNAVTIADLAALANIPIPPPAEVIMMPPMETIPEQPNITQPPQQTKAERSQGGGIGMYVFIVVIAVLGGGAGWYFKIYRPKQQRMMDDDEYDPAMDEENEDSENWNEDDNTPPWDEDEGENEDNE